jgi:hypothetical protein
MLQGIVHGQMNKITVAMNVRFGSQADICAATSDVCFTPESRRVQCNGSCLLRTKSGLAHYSNTSSVRPISVLGIEAERLRGLQIDVQFDFSGLLDR